MSLCKMMPNDFIVPYLPIVSTFRYKAAGERHSSRLSALQPSTGTPAVYRRSSRLPALQPSTGAPAVFLHRLVDCKIYFT
jgi:hypothetical protein